MPKLNNTYNISTKCVMYEYIPLFSTPRPRLIKIVIENEDAIFDYNYYGICFGNSELVLFDNDDNCFSNFGNKYSHYETNGITRDEFCGETKRSEYSNYFIPIEIEDISSNSSLNLKYLVCVTGMLYINELPYISLEDNTYSV